MHRTSGKAISTLLVGVVILSLVLASVKVSSAMTSGASIDLFTQQTPYSGRGHDVASDAFGPGDVVILNALVTVNDTPVQNLLVSFNVVTPSNMSFSLTASTNSSGLASVNFTLPTPSAVLNESQIFGTWHASASAAINGNNVQDDLSFQVNWVVQVTSVRTIDGNLSGREVFGLGGDVGFEVALRSISYSFKSVTLAVTVLDALNVPINSSQIDGFVVQPNSTLMLVYVKASIPNSGVFIGNATAFLSVLTGPASQGGVAYSPSASVVFEIVPTGNLTIALHDVAVIDVVASAASIRMGQLVSLDVLVQNEGTQTEAFVVNAFLGDVLVGSLGVPAISPYRQANLHFNVNTLPLSPGNYTVRAVIPALPNEADTADNVFVDGVVDVTPIHNVAVTDVEISSTSLHIGEVLKINVTVLNKGNATETFPVTTYFNSSPIQTIQVGALAPSAQTMLTFTWNTGSVAEGVYRISAFAFLPTDIDLSDNTFADGFVTLSKALVHDIAVTDVTVSSSSVHVGDIVQADVVVLNKGDFAEAFNVTAYYNSSVIGTSLVNLLAAKSNMTLFFMWNTSSVTEGTYQIRASVPLVGDVNPSDNTFVDGFVTVGKALVNDIAVTDVTVSNSSVHVGDIVQVDVVVLNKGGFAETFNVTAYYDSSVIGTSQVNSLGPKSKMTLTFMWDTSSVAEGTYHISASAPLTGDVNASDNTFSDGTVEILPALVHNIGITGVKTSATTVHAGDLVQINVTVLNKGDAAETFNVTTYYNSILIKTLQVTALAPGAVITLTISWNTSNVAEGIYQVSASAPLPKDVDTVDNKFFDGFVTVTEPSPGPFPGFLVRDLFLWLLLAILILLILLMIYLYWRERRKREEEKRRVSSIAQALPPCLRDL